MMMFATSMQDGSTPLLEACKQQQLDIILKLTDAEADVNVVDEVSNQEIDT